MLPDSIDHSQSIIAQLQQTARGRAYGFTLQIVAARLRGYRSLSGRLRICEPLTT